MTEYSPANDAQIELMRKFWEETPDQPAQRPLTVKLLKKDFLSLIAKIELLEAELAATLTAAPASDEPVPLDAFKAIEAESNQLRELCTKHRNEAAELRSIIRDNWDGRCWRGVNHDMQERVSAALGLTIDT